MKCNFLGFALLGALFPAAAWSHHAAKGIVADEIWSMIDQNLQDADSPHLDIDLSDPGNLNMTIETSDDGLFIVSTVNVDFLDDANSQQALDIINTEFADAFDTTISGMGQIPSGTIGCDVLALVDDDQDGYVEYAVISIAEPIGRGASQDIPTDTPSLPPGNGAGGSG